MTDEARYTTEIVPPEQDGYGARYRVDLVRETQDAEGNPREQRLTLGEHPSWSEAEEQWYEVEDRLAQDNLEAHLRQVKHQPYTDATVYQAGEGRDTVLDSLPHEPVRHVDGGGTAHWFAVVETADQSQELRYFRELTLTDDETRTDSYPVMPAEEGETWAQPALELYLTRGDVFMAQQLAHDVADAYGETFPHPLELPALDPRPDYYFGYGVGPSNSPSLEAVKTWMDGAERRFDTLTVGEYGTFDEAAVDELELETLLKDEGLEAAMHQAEGMAVAGGYLDPKRADPRIFFEADAPPDPFQTMLQQERGRQLIDEIELLEPLDDVVNYAVVLDDDSLRVEKHWKQADGSPGVDQLVVMAVDPEAKEQAEQHRDNLLGTYDDIGLQGMMHQAELTAMLHGTLDAGRMDTHLFTDGPPDRFETLAQRLEGEVNPYFNTSGEKIEEADPNLPQYGIGAIAANGEAFIDVVKSWGEYQYERLVIPQPSWEEAQFQAESAFTLQQTGDLQGAMRQVESLAEEAGVLDPERDDPRLFQTGPPDPFVTNRELAMDAELDRYGVTWRETHEWENEAPKVENPYWRWDTLPVNDPDGEPLGHVLHMVVYPGVEHDPEAVGSPAIPDDAPFRMLEVAHFETQEGADKFSKQFNSYLMPGLLEAPELAEEVAKLEGHSAEWRTLEGQELDDYRALKLTLTRDPADWQPYNPNAERDARIEAEGLYIDPIHMHTVGKPFTTFNEDEDDPKVEPATPDFDL